MKKTIRDFVLITFGTLLVAVGVYFFKFPNHFSTGGVSGLSIILGSLIKGISAGAFVFILNMIFLLLGFIFLNRGFGIKTVYSSVLFSVATWGLEAIYPMSSPLTGQKLLELVFAILLPAIGSAILFNIGASTGGTDIAAMILKKYTNLDIGKSLLCTDFLIALSAAFAFGIETGLFSILGLVLKAVVVDSVIENINLKKSFTIITTKPHDICEYITKTLHRGATFWPAKGAYTEQEKWVVLTIVDRVQANHLRQYVKKVDDSAFFMLTNSSEIIGKGFRSI